MAFLRPPGVGTGTMAEGRRHAVHAPAAGADAPRRAGRAQLDRPSATGGRCVSIDWYLVVSALIFCIGAGGVLTRRNPLVVLLCLELMLNAGEPRADRVRAHVGQRRRPDLRDHRDGRRRLRGVHRPRRRSSRCTAAACRSTSTSCGSCRAEHGRPRAWLVLAVPARRARSSSRSATACWPARVAGWIGTARDRRRVRLRGARRADHAAGPRRGAAPGRLRRCGTTR